MPTVWANQKLLDRLITSADGDHVGMVDDLELDMQAARGPVVTAFLCGPTALGPRIGGRLGTAWLAVARRLRPTGSAYPNRVPVETVETLDATGIQLSVDADEIGTHRLEDWLRDYVITRIPGSGKCEPPT